MTYEKNIWHNPLMNRIENALELAFKEIEALKTQIETLKADCEQRAQVFCGGEDTAQKGRRPV